MALPGVYSLLALLLAGTSVASGQNKEVYFAGGEPFAIEPKPVGQPITSITWKFKVDIVTEWIKDVVEVSDFGDFKGRTALDTTTGKLTINPARSSDAGTFSVEINNRVQQEVYNAVHIQKVSEPYVVLRPLTCSKDSERCSLSCEGDFGRSDLVSYFWRKDDGGWEEGEKDKNITNDAETRSVKTFSCKVQNPVSQKESKAADNLFYTPDPPHPASYVVPIILIAAGGAGVGYWQKDRLRELLNRNQGGTSNDAAARNDDNTKGETVMLNVDSNTQP